MSISKYCPSLDFARPAPMFIKLQKFRTIDVPYLRCFSGILSLNLMGGRSKLYSKIRIFRSTFDSWYGFLRMPAKLEYFSSCIVIVRISFLAPRRLAGFNPVIFSGVSATNMLDLPELSVLVEILCHETNVSSRYSSEIGEYFLLLHQRAFRDAPGIYHSSERKYILWTSQIMSFREFFPRTYGVRK